MTYKASLDKAATVITVAITISFAVTILFAVIMISQYVFKDAGLWVFIIIITIILLIYFLSFAFRPINYVITGNDLIIRRPLSNVQVKKADIRSVEVIEPVKIKGSVMTFGVAGLFGYYGRFINLDTGRMTWYATRKDKLVLVTTTGDKKIILTPDEPEKFVAEFRG